LTTVRTTLAFPLPPASNHRLKPVHPIVDYLLRACGRRRAPRTGSTAAGGRSHRDGFGECERMSEIDEIVGESIEELGVEAALEHSETAADRPWWERWVVVSSTALALVSALAALFATFASDQALDLQTSEAMAATHEVGYLATAEILRIKEDITLALGKTVSDEDRGRLTAAEAKARMMHERIEEYHQQVNERDGYHDLLAVSVTLCQIAILMSGLAVMLKMLRVWIGGMAFAAAGTGLLVWTLLVA
jgi:hypothetical protein